MATLDELRLKLPRLLDGLDDSEAVSVLRDTYYPDLEPDAIAKALGVKLPPAPPPPVPKRSIMAGVNDTVIELANAAAGGVKAGADFVAPGNPVSQFIDTNIIKPGEANQSDAVKAEKARLQQELQGATGIMDEAGAALGYVARNPVLATAQAVGSFALPAGAVKAGGLMAKGLGLGATGATRAGLAGGAVAGAALSGGDAAGTAYELAKRAGATEEQAVEAARQASVIPAAIGGAGGVIGAERLVAGAKGFGGGAVSRALKTGGVEALQEGVEEGVTQYEGQRAAMPYDPTIDPTKGVAGAATLGAALGGITGAGVSLLSRHEASAKAMDDLARAPDVDSAVDAFNRATDVPIVGLTAEQENAAMGAMERQADADLKGIRQFGPGGTPLPPQRTAAPGSMGTAEVTDSPLADRILSLREELADQNTREKIRGAMGMEALQNALYYLDRADGAKDIPDATRERMLGVAEEIVSRSILRPIRKPGQIAASEFGAPGQLGMTPDTAPRLTAGSTPTGTVKVDSAGNAMPETQADRTSLRQRAEAMKRRGMENQTPRGGEPGAGVMVGEGTLTTPQRKTPAPPAPQPTLLLTSDGMPYGTRSAAYVRAKKEGGEVVDVPGGWAVEVAAAPAVDSGSAAPAPVAAAPSLQQQWRDAVARGDNAEARRINDQIVAAKAAAKNAAAPAESPGGALRSVAPNTKQPEAAAPTKTGDPMLDNPASWVIRNKATGEVVMETFDRAKVDALNTEKYEAVPIAQHLREVNTQARGATPEVPNAPVQPPRADETTPRAAAPTAEATQAAGGDAATEASVPGARAVATTQANGVMPAGLRVTFGGKTYPVESIEDAQRKWEAFRDETGAGVSSIGNGVRVTDGAGRFVARISYNGRAWDTEDDGAGGGRVIAEAPDVAPSRSGGADAQADGVIPRPGLRFFHRRVLDADNKPMEYSVTRVANGVVYYAPVDGGKSEKTGVDEFAKVFGRASQPASPIDDYKARLEAGAKALGMRPGAAPNSYVADAASPSAGVKTTASVRFVRDGDKLGGQITVTATKRDPATGREVSAAPADPRSIFGSVDEILAAARKAIAGQGPWATPAPATPESVAQPKGERNGVRQEGRGRQEKVAPTQEAGMAPAEFPAPETVKQLTDSPTLRERAKGMGKRATAQAAIDAFNADDAATAMLVASRLPLADLQEVGAAIGFRPQINENAKRFRERLAEVAPRLTKTEREKSARQRVLFDKLMNRAMDYDRAADHAARAKANGVAEDSTAYDSFYKPMDGGETEMVRIPEMLDRLAADVASLKDDPDYAAVAPMVREKRPRVFEHKPAVAGLTPTAEAEPDPAAKPAPLYVSRPLTPASAEAIRAWAATQGFKTTLPAADMHVTVAYSREPVDGAAIPADTTALTVPAGKRTVEPLGNEGAVVLKFDSPALQARWKAYRKAGASWDYESYTPHVTITYDGAGVDLAKVKPYTGPIDLAAETQEPLNVDKAEDYKEAGEVATPSPAPAEEQERLTIPSGAAGDALMRSLPIDTKEQAQVFVRAHKDWLAANNPYGMGAMTPKNAKPATLRAPDIGEKVRRAYDIAEANYWQMPYSEAKVRFYGLPRAKWEAERSKRGLPTDDEAPAPAEEGGAKAEKPAAPTTPPMPVIGSIPFSAAQDAHRGTSHVPEVRAKQEQDGFRAALADAWARAARAAGNDPAAIERITELFTEVADGYRSRYMATLGARSRVMSSMIAGPARFPVERNRKRMETERRRAEEAEQYLERGIKRLLRAARGPIDNSPESQLERVRLNLSQREEQQETMKAANAALRKGDDAALEDLGYTPEQIAELKKPDFAGRKGFPDYKLVNNNAEIRRLRERLKSAEERMDAAQAGPVETEREGVRMVEDATDDRLRLIFDGKPSEAVREDLKANGFKWSPKNEAWQRQLTDNAKAAANKVLDKHYPAQPAGDSAFSRGRRQTGVPMQDAKAVVDAIREALPNAPPIYIHETVRQAPAALRADIRAAGADNDVEAAFHAGEIHVFPGNIASIERMQFVVAHHEIRHYGFRGMLGPRLGQVMLGIYMANPAVKAAAQAKMDAGLANTRVLAVEEALADMDPDEIAKLKGMDKLMSIVRDFLRGFAARLRKMGMNTVADMIEPKGWTDADVARFVLKAENIARDGKAEFRTGGTVFQKVWHGTPYRGIEKFDTSKIGTGEGAQAYGWGLYFAGAKDVAEFYRKTLSVRNGLTGVDGKRYGVAQADAEADAIKLLTLYRQEPKNFAQYLDGGQSYLGKIARDIKSGKIKANEGQLYEVEIPEDSEMLLWDKPLSEQPKGVQRSIASMAIGDGRGGVVSWEGKSGEYIYQKLASSWGGQQYASEAMSAAGIKGIKYLDGTSRAAGDGSYNYVIFSGDDAAIQGTLYSRAAGQNLTAQDLINAKGGVFDFNRLGATGQDRVRTAVDGSRPFWLGALTRDQIADMYGDEIPPVRDYDELTRAMENERQSMAQDADALYEKWSKLPADANERLARVMLDATVAQVHPDRELQADATDDQRKAHAMLRAQFKMLPKEAQAIYREVRDYHSGTLAKLKTALEGRIERLIDNSKERAVALADIRQRFDQYLKGGPYFPLHRFGEFLVIAERESDGERVVAAYETAGEQQAGARALRADGFTTKLKMAKGYSRSLDGSAGKFIGDVLVAIDKMDLREATINGSTTDMKAQLLDDLNQLFIKAMPDLSFRKHFTHRKGTAGFSADVMRGFASSAFHAASHIARLNHGDKMTFALEDAYKAIEQAPEGDFTRESQVLNELTKRHDAAMDPHNHPLSVLATQLGFVMYLGLSPAAGLINMLQVPMVALPWIGARYGFGKASATLGAAYKDIMAAAPNAKSGFNAAQSPKLTTEERRAMSVLQDEGVIDLTQAHDLAAATSRDMGNQARSRASFAIARAMKIVGWTFHVPEVMNRQVTALTAYRLEMAKTGDTEAAMTAAREAINRTQFDYSSSNRARFMQGDVARVVLQFKQFSQNMTYFLGRAAYQALKGEDPEVRAIARRQILSTFAVTGAMAGTMGLPGVGVVGGLLGALASAMAGDDDEPWDWKTEYRNLLADTFGKEAGEVIAKGVPRALMPWDISSRVSLPDLWWRDAGREGQSPRESFASDMANILGPTAGSILGWYTAADQMARGDYSKAVEAIVPKFIRDPLKAAREVQDGITSYNGEPLMETTAVEDLGRILGFSSSRASEMFEARGAVMNAKTVIEDKRSRLLSKMVKARLDGDSESAAELQSDIDGFNRQHPEFKITSMTIAQSLMTRRRNRANTEDGIMLPDSKDVLRQGGRFAVLE